MKRSHRELTTETFAWARESAFPNRQVSSEILEIMRARSTVSLRLNGCIVSPDPQTTRTPRLLSTAHCFLGRKPCCAALRGHWSERQKQISRRVSKETLRFSIGNPIITKGFPLKILDFHKLPKSKILESLRIEFIPTVLSGIRVGIDSYTTKWWIRQSKSDRNTFREAGRACYCGGW